MINNPFVPEAGPNLRYADETTLAADHDLIPESTDTYDLGSTTKLWRKGYLSELDAVLFAENTITLLGGWFYVTKNAGAFAADVGAADGQIDFGKAMTPGDLVVMRAALKVEYLQVGSLVSGTTYNVTRNLDGTGANDWPAGTPFAVLGTSGDGRIELNAYDTPRIQLLRQGATYAAQTELIRLGDLDGNWGYSSPTWGLAIGEYAPNKPNLTLDPTNGLRIRHYQTDLLTFDPSGNARIAGVLNLGTAGGIYQGSGSFAEPTTGLKLWNQDGVGKIAGYASGTVQWYADTDGIFKAGAGNVLLGATGIQIVASDAFEDQRMYRFTYGGTTLGGLYGLNTLLGDTVIGLRTVAIAGKASTVYLASYTDANELSTVQVSAQSAVGTGSQKFTGITLTAHTDGLDAHNSAIIGIGGAEILKAYGDRVEIGGLVRTNTYYRFGSNPDNPADSTASLYNQAGVGPTISGYQFEVRTGSDPAQALVVTATRGIRIAGPSSAGTGDAALSVGGYGLVNIDYPGVVGGRLQVTEAGAIWIRDNCSALSFTDRTPYPRDKAEALAAVLSVRGKPGGGLDHAALHPSLQARDAEGNVVGRDLSATVSALLAVVQDLTARLDKAKP